MHHHVRPHLYLDTNILLDAVMDRPKGAESRAIIARIKQHGWLCSTGRFAFVEMLDELQRDRRLPLFRWSWNHSPFTESDLSVSLLILYYKGAQMISGTFYTLGEVAQLMAKNRLTIRRWLKSGKLRGQRLGNVVLIRKEEVDRLSREEAA